MIVGTVLLVVGLWYLAQPGRTPQTAVADIAAYLGTIPLTADQVLMKHQIETTFAAAGLGWLAPAAVANAWAESRLDPRAVGDGGRAVGLFQLHEAGGGAGMGDLRLSAAANIERTIVLARSAPALMALRGVGTHAEATRVFARDVERCAACGHQSGSAQLWARERYLRALYPGIADQVAG